MCHVTDYTWRMIKSFADKETMEFYETGKSKRHELQRERKGQYSISVNDQWRICFRFEDGDAYDVELTDYH
jgi:proteic killer suppression protein